LGQLAMRGLRSLVALVTLAQDDGAVPSGVKLFGENVSTALLDAHNGLRRRAGLPELRWSTALQGIANEWLLSSARDNHCRGAFHSSREFRTAHPSSPFYYLGETVATRSLPLSGGPDKEKLAIEAVHRWGAPMLRNVTYGRWGSPCSVRLVYNVRVLSEALAVAEGLFQTLWAETTEVGCEAAFCEDAASSKPSRSFLLVCEYGPGGNVLGELPFSPTTSTYLDLRPDPCDGPLTDSEWLQWERWDAKHYPLPVAEGTVGLSIGFAVLASLCVIRISFLGVLF